MEDPPRKKTKKVRFSLDLCGHSALQSAAADRKEFQGRPISEEEILNLEGADNVPTQEADKAARLKVKQFAPNFAKALHEAAPKGIPSSQKIQEAALRFPEEWRVVNGILWGRGETFGELLERGKQVAKRKLESETCEEFAARQLQPPNGLQRGMGGWFRLISPSEEREHP